jgi:hypothetical protein
VKRALAALLVLLPVACTGDHPPSGPEPPTVGPDGATLTSGSGEEVRFPAGAVAHPVQVRLTGLDQAEAERLLGRTLADDGFAYVGGIHLEAGAADFLVPVALSVPNRLGLTSSDVALVAALVPDVDEDARADLLLVEIARGAGNRVETASPPFPGILQPGRYVMLQYSQPWRFMAGSVVAGQGAPLPGAIVTTREAPRVLARTGPTGAFVIAAPAALSVVTIVAANQARTAFGLLKWRPHGAAVLPPSQLPSIPATLTLQGLRLAVDFQSKCPAPDRFLEDALQQILKQQVQAMVALLQTQGIPIEPTPDTLFLPAAPRDTLRVDFGKYLLPRDFNPVTLTLGPFGLGYKVSLLQATVLVWDPRFTPVSSNPAVVSIAPWSLDDAGVASMEITGGSVGEALIIGAVPAVGMELRLTYSFDQEEGESCPEGITGRLEVNLAPSSGPSMYLVPDPITVLGAELEVVPGFARLNFGKTLQLVAVRTGARPDTVKAGVTWSSSDTTAAVVDHGGLVTGRWPSGACFPTGRNCPIEVTVTATDRTLTGSAVLRVGAYNVTIEGTVREQDTAASPGVCRPAPITGAIVGTSLDSVTATTDGTGRFFLATDTPVSSDPTGGNYRSTPYTIRVSAPGYQPISTVLGWGAFPTGQTFCLSR